MHRFLKYFMSQGSSDGDGDGNGEGQPGPSTANSLSPGSSQGTSLKEVTPGQPFTVSRLARYGSSSAEEDNIAGYIKLPGSLCFSCSLIDVDCDVPYIGFEKLKQFSDSRTLACPCCRLIYERLKQMVISGDIIVERQTIDALPHRNVGYQNTGMQESSLLELLDEPITIKFETYPGRSKILYDGLSGVVFQSLDWPRKGQNTRIAFEFFRQRALLNPEIDVLTIPGRPQKLHDLSDLGFGVELQDHATSAGCYKIVADWINNCLSCHYDCRQKYRFLPTRVINISKKNPFLQDGNEINARYVALSHRWGSKPTITTTEASINDWQRNIPMSKLPRTFQDAITVSKTLGIEYLWIDSLCIIQDSDEEFVNIIIPQQLRTDILYSWLVESQNMLQYYRDAFLTISVLDSPDSHHGFLDSREKLPWVKLTSDNLFLRHKLPEQHEVFQKALLSRRAWVLQERLLSTRVLHYSNRELFWECLTCSARESSLQERGGYVDPSSVMLSEGDDFKRILSTLSKSSPSSVKHDSMIVWYRLVTQYSRKEMTRSSDKLPAISGIASAIQAATGYTYLAGIWREDLNGLLWFSDESQDSPEGYNAPSWSWASRGAVSLRYSFEKTITSSKDAEIVDSHVKNIGKGRFGQVSSAHITLRAFTTTLCYQPSRYEHRLDDKPWSLAGFQTHEGQDVDLYMTASLGFGKGFLDIIDEELLAAKKAIENAMPTTKGVEVIFSPNFPDPKHNFDFTYRLCHPSLRMKQCVAIWMAKRVGEADSYMGGCENDRKGQADVVREILYCLLVVEDKIEKGKWRRIGVARAPVDYIQQCSWSEKRDMVLI